MWFLRQQFCFHRVLNYFVWAELYLSHCYGKIWRERKKENVWQLFNFCLSGCLWFYIVFTILYMNSMLLRAQIFSRKVSFSEAMCVKYESLNELMCLQASEKYCIRMPNKWNFSFDNFYAAILALGIYVPGTNSPYLSIGLLVICLMTVKCSLIQYHNLLQAVLTCSATCSHRGRKLSQNQKESRMATKFYNVISVVYLYFVYVAWNSIAKRFLATKINATCQLQKGLFMWLFFRNLISQGLKSHNSEVLQYNSV